MALVCDPKVLLKAAKCLPCLTPRQVRLAQASLFCSVAAKGIPGMPPGSVLTNFLWVPRSGSGVSSQAIGSWDVPPSGFTGTELWTSPDNITYVLAGTVAAPGTNLAFSVAAGTVRWAKARWVPGGQFCSPQEVSGNVCDWARRCIANGALSTSLTTRQALNTMDLAIIAAAIDSQMVYVLPLANDSLTVALTPLYNSGGNDPATNHNFLAGDLTGNGLIGDGATKFLDTAIIPSTVWPLGGNKDNGLTVYNMTAQNNATSLEAGALQGGNNCMLEVDFNDGHTYFSTYGSTDGTSRVNAANTLFTGFVSGNRTSPSRADVYTGNSVTPFSSIGNATGNLGQSGTTLGQGMYVMAVNNTGAAASFSSRRMSFLAFHNGLTSAQCQAFFNAVQAYRVSMGGGFV